MRTAAYPGAAKLGRGVGYDDPHAHPGGLSPQSAMPEGLEGLRFYDPPAETEGRFGERAREIARARDRPYPDDVHRPDSQPPR